MKNKGLFSIEIMLEVQPFFVDEDFEALEGAVIGIYKNLGK